MKERFEGDNRPALIESLKRQELTGGDPGIANALADAGTIKEFKPRETLIVEGAEDNDLFLILAGTVAVVIKGQEVRTLKAGQHVGEMSAIEPSCARSASVMAEDTVVALRIKAADLRKVCDAHPEVWKPIAQELCRRLSDRNRLMAQPNDAPRLFIISSVEALDVANQIQSGLQHDVLATVWTNGVFWAGGYPLEALENAVRESDFAVAVAQFEDIVESRGERRPTLRDNVLFELGIFMGHLGRRRTILVHPRLPDLKLPSDLHGLVPASYAPGDLKDLPARLGPVCTEISKLVRSLGIRTASG